MQNTSNNILNTPLKGLVTDFDPNMVSKELWTNARNAQMNSHLGQIQFLQNEPSNYKCIDVPYQPIGFIKILNQKWVIFSTDEINSEIGIFDEPNCTYTTLVNNKCLGFSKHYLVKGVSKEMFDCSESIYWTDGFNPRRTLNLSNIPYTYTVADDACETKQFTKDLDCSELLIDKKINIPSITSRLSTSGALKNGSYQFGMAYSVNKTRVTDYYSITRPQHVWSHQNNGQSIEVNIDGLDRDYDEYELIVIYEVDEAINYKSLGFYAISTNAHLISSVNRREYSEISLEEIITPRPRYPYADEIAANDQYLLWSGVKTTADISYQKAALDITSQYVIYQVPADYYAKGGQLVGYRRDETYAFGIQWLYDNGAYSSVFHIPGRADKGEKVLASGKDVYEATMKDALCGEQTELQRWQVENTAGGPAILSTTSQCDERAIATGDMAYWESSEVYPTNVEMFGDLACAPIRHHKFPDECKANRYSNSGAYINILGVQFSNIEHPKDINGKYMTNIVGYRILRGDRDGNKTVVCNGVVTNVRSYKETNNKTVFYTNYPYNDLRPDSFLSSAQTQNKNSETGYIALTGFEKDKFNFYSPNTLFQNVSLGDEINFLTEETATTDGYFEHVYKHPKQKMLTQFDMYFALIIGALDGYYAVSGKKGHEIQITSNNMSSLTLGLGTLFAGDIPVTLTPGSVLGNSNKIESAVNDALAFTSAASVQTVNLNFAEKVLRGLATAGVFAYFSLQTANKVLQIIQEASPWEDYSMQYDSHALFNNIRCITKDNKRRHIDYYQYLYDGINTVQGTSYNNYKRENSVYIQTNDVVDVPKTVDKSRQTITDLSLCGDFSKPVTTTASLFYTSIKRKIPNQYGQVDSVAYIDTGDGIQALNANNIVGSTEKIYTSGYIFGGDTYVTKFAVRRTHHYFSQELFDVPDGYILDYRLYRNVGFPRYWMDSTPYDMSNIATLNPTQSRTPKNKHNFSCEGENNAGITVVTDRYFYLTNSGAMEFFVESDINTDLRDWKLDQPNFYSRYNQDLSTLFRSDKSIIPEEFVYDKSFSKQIEESIGFQQRIDYNQQIESTCYTYLKNRVIYSLPAFKDQKSDNWLVYLANNKYDFPMSEFGQITTMQPIDNQQIIFLFDKASPYVTIGRDMLQLDGSGKTITLGDGGLFTRDPRPIVYTDFYYGNSQSDFAFVNTQFGSFFPSQRQGRVFQLTGMKLDDITRNGLDYWFNINLPSKLLQQFPNIQDKDNPIAGTGLLLAFDNSYEKLYIIKKDYSLRDDWLGKVVYDTTKNKFFNGSLEVSLDDPTIFDDASFTLSYDPKTKSFISWHDWHPQYTLQGENHFLTVKDNAIWKHNDRYDSFCNFYGVDYPFTIEYVVNNGAEVEILRNVEYILDVGKYYSNGRQFHQILDTNFDRMVVHNNEQISGYLELTLQSKTDMRQLTQYPAIDSVNNQIRVLYNKEEQKYRVNQFWDITKDRGEFDKKNFPLWDYDTNGYTRTIVDASVNYNKVDQFRKKFRSNWHKVELTKQVCGDNKFIFKFSNNKELISFR